MIIWTQEKILPYINVIERIGYQADDKKVRINRTPVMGRRTTLLIEDIMYEVT